MALCSCLSFVAAFTLPPPGRRDALNGLAIAAAATLALPANAVVEGVCVDGALKWQLYRQGKGPEPGRWCEEFSYTESAAFKQVSADQLQVQRAKQADADAAAEDVRASLAAFKTRGRAVPPPGDAGPPAPDQ